MQTAVGNCPALESTPGRPGTMSKRGVGFVLLLAVATLRCTGPSDTLQDGKLVATQHSAEPLPARQDPLQGDLCYERSFQLRRKSQSQSQTLVLAFPAEDKDSLAVTVHRHAADLQAIATHWLLSLAPRGALEAFFDSSIRRHFHP